MLQKTCYSFIFHTLRIDTHFPVQSECRRYIRVVQLTTKSFPLFATFALTRSQKITPPSLCSRLNFPIYGRYLPLIGSFSFQLKTFSWPLRLKVHTGKKKLFRPYTLSDPLELYNVWAVVFFDSYMYILCIHVT